MMCLRFVAVAVLSAILRHSHVNASPVLPCQTQLDGWFRHPTDCRQFYACVGGVPSGTLMCHKNTVYSVLKDRCVWRYSADNDCNLPDKNEITSPSPSQSTTPPSLTVAERCQQDPTAVLADPEGCQLYYNCSHDAIPNSYSRLSRYQQECPYPQLFSTVTSRCQSYTAVSCGERKEALDACEYVQNQCLTSHCRPCSIRFHSCRGKPDGITVFEGREWTPVFGVCKDQRYAGHGTCPAHSTLSITQIFSPIKKQCVSLYEVPREHGGFPLHCSGRKNGLYPDDVTFRPELYFMCHGGQVMFIQLCRDGNIFDRQTSSCVPRKK